ADSAMNISQKSVLRPDVFLQEADKKSPKAAISAVQKDPSRLTKAQLIDQNEELRRRNQELERAANKMTVAPALDVLEKAESLVFIEATEHCTDGFALFDGEDRFVVCNATYRSAMDDFADILEPGISFEELIRIRADRNLRKDGL
ncbi:MAG: PAS-domain containing protein, partial [Alphaproteobacteria bacterium]